MGYGPSKTGNGGGSSGKASSTVEHSPDIDKPESDRQKDENKDSMKGNLRLDSQYREGDSFRQGPYSLLGERPREKYSLGVDLNFQKERAGALKRIEIPNQTQGEKAGLLQDIKFTYKGVSSFKYFSYEFTDFSLFTKGSLDAFSVSIPIPTGSPLYALSIDISPKEAALAIAIPPPYLGFIPVFTGSVGIGKGLDIHVNVGYMKSCIDMEIPTGKPIHQWIDEINQQTGNLLNDPEREIYNLYGIPFGIYMH